MGLYDAPNDDLDLWGLDPNADPRAEYYFGDAAYAQDLTQEEIDELDKRWQ